MKNKNVFIRTVTHYFTGKVERVTKSWIVLSSAAWIADTGRFADAMRSGKLNEVEPYPKNTIVRVARGSIIEISDWQHALPMDQQ